MRSRTIIRQSGRTATGIQVPDEVVEALGAGRRPAVKGTVNATPTAAPWRSWAAPP